MLTPKDVHALLTAADGDAGLFTPRAALATLVRTRGSSFRRVGSQMLFGGNGRVVRGFSGGCPDSDIELRARRVIELGVSERALYDREHGLDLLLEMGCGGELEFVVEPVADRTSLRFLDVIAAIWQSRSPAMMASVFFCDPEKAVCRIIWRGGEILLDELRDETGLHAILDSDSFDAAVPSRTLAIGGAMADVLYAPIRPPIRLLLIGANAVADGVAEAASKLAWPLLRVDPKTTAADQLVEKNMLAEAQRAPVFDSNTFVVCMTYQLERDLDYAAAALATRVPYVGILGSQQRAQRIRRRLGERCGTTALERLYTPAGLSVGSENVEEIAISLIAEIMAVAARKSGTPLSRSAEPIHSPGALDAIAELRR